MERVLRKARGIVTAKPRALRAFRVTPEGRNRGRWVVRVPGRSQDVGVALLNLKSSLLLAFLAGAGPLPSPPLSPAPDCPPAPQAEKQETSPFDEEAPDEEEPTELDPNGDDWEYPDRDKSSGPFDAEDEEMQA
jgi:hypothetical protein